MNRFARSASKNRRRSFGFLFRRALDHDKVAYLVVFAERTPMPAEKIAPENVVHSLPHLIERMHRRFLDVVRLEMERQGVVDISPVQTMMLGAIGNEEISVRELIERGYYLGSNASYNLKQLLDRGYVDRLVAPRDKRSARLRVTKRGEEVLVKLRQIESASMASLLRDTPEALAETYHTLRALEAIWTHMEGPLG
jgi:DNA-binding MarR family transcriptional regulator